MNNTKLTSNDMDIEQIASAIIGAAVEVHRTLGAGLPRPIYLACLAHELELRGFDVLTQAAQTITYKDKQFESGVVLEMLVENQIAVVCETVEQIEEIHVLKLLNQIINTEIKLGLIINFDVKYLRGDAIRRVVNGRL
jgi:GxxExxY protein